MNQHMFKIKLHLKFQSLTVIFHLMEFDGLNNQTEFLTFLCFSSWYYLKVFTYGMGPWYESHQNACKWNEVPTLIFMRRI